MKNKLQFLLFSFFLSVAAMAQTSRIGEHAAITKWTPATTGFNSAQQGKQIAQQIMDAVGLKPSFEMVAANIDNAAAVVYGGKRFVLFNPSFINNLVKTTGTEWAAISVLAHEIGHHLNGHTVTPGGSQPALELEADEFSGYVLRKLGATLPQAQAAMKTLASTRASRTHPAQYDRLTSIENGWNHADDQVAGRSTKKTPEVQPKVTQEQTDVVAVSRPASGNTLDSRYILGDVFFDAAPSTTFYITTNYNLVKVNDAKLSVLGKLAKTTSNQFPYLLYDSQSTRLFVSRNGTIVNSNGKQVGYLRNHNG